MIFQPATWPNPGVPVAGPVPSPQRKHAGEGLGLDAPLPASGRLGFGSGQKGGWPWPVKWFFCRPGAKLLPFPTAFVSANWDSEQEWNPTLGEPHHWKAQPYYNGLAPLSALGNKSCGNEAQFIFGIKDYCGTNYDAFGLPVCCGGSLAAGNLGLNKAVIPAPLRNIVFGPSIVLPAATGNIVLTSYPNSQLSSIALAPIITGASNGNIGLGNPAIPPIGDGADIGFCGSSSSQTSGLVMTGGPVLFTLGSFGLGGPKPSRLNLTGFVSASGGFGLGSSVNQSRHVVFSKAEQGSAHLVLSGLLPQAGAIVLGSVVVSGAAESAIVFTPFVQPIAPTNLIGFGTAGAAEGRIGLGILFAYSFGLRGVIDCLSGCYTDDFSSFGSWSITANQLVQNLGGEAIARFAPRLRQGTQTIAITQIGMFNPSSQNFILRLRGECSKTVFVQCESLFGFGSPGGPGSLTLFLFDTAGNNVHSTPTFGITEGDTLQWEIADDGSNVVFTAKNVTTSTTLVSITLPTTVFGGMIFDIAGVDLNNSPITALTVNDSSGTTWSDNFNGPNGPLASHRPISGCT